jgi:hypothetical protein
MQTLLSAVGSHLRNILCNIAAVGLEKQQLKNEREAFV